ncbi:MAG: hypothetical protein IJ645_07540 [Ruminococcus sp.]|nr:hypothetical protein [Ruminococcus sp.]
MPTKANILDFTDLDSINESVELFPKIYNEVMTAAGENTSPAFNDILTQFNKAFNMLQRKSIKQSPMNASEADEYTDTISDLNAALSQFAGKKNVSVQEKNAVKLMKDSLADHGKRFNELEGYFRKAATQKYVGDTYDLIFDYDRNANTIYGDKYATLDSRQSLPNPSGYSVYRTALQSITMLTLADRGYSIEEITDPDMLQDKKKEVCEEVLGHIKGGTKKDQEWLAQKMYNGHKKAVALMNEAAKEIDFSNLDIAHDRKAIQLAKMADAAFDSWQELDHCKDEFFALAKKDHPECKTPLDCKNKLYNELPRTYKAAFQAVANVPTRMNEFDIKPTGSKAKQVIAAHAAFQTHIGLLAERQKQYAGTDKPLSEWLTPEELFQGEANIDPMANMVIPTKMPRLNTLTSEQADAISKDILSMNYAKKMRISLDKDENGMNKITGLPETEEIDSLLRMRTGPKADRFDEVIANIEVARNLVHWNSGEFSDARSALKELNTAYKAYHNLDHPTDAERSKALDELRKKQEKAEQKLNKWFERKAKNGFVDSPDLVNGKSTQQKRYDIMKQALNETRAIKADLDRMAKDRYEVNNKFNLSESYRKRADKATGYDKISVTAAQEAYVLLSDKSQMLDINKPFSKKEMQEIKKNVAAIIYDHQLHKTYTEGEIGMIKEDKDMYLNAVERIENSQAMEQTLKDFDRKQLNDFVSSPKKTIDKFLTTEMRLVGKKTSNMNVTGSSRNKVKDRKTVNSPKSQANKVRK